MQWGRPVNTRMLGNNLDKMKGRFSPICSACSFFLCHFVFSSLTSSLSFIWLSQVSGRLHSVRFLPLYRVRELADSFRLWQHPWPCSLSSAPGFSLLHHICCCCCSLRFPAALQFSGWRTQWKNVSNTVQPLHHFPSCQAFCWNSVK